MNTRPEFVKARNAFFGNLCEAYRRADTFSRVASMSGDSLNAGNRASEARAEMDAAEEMEEDYSILKDVSAKKNPEQTDFDKAERICKKWQILG